MKIKSVVINNYKSLGEEKNILFLEDGITALIGKNDSGKSNILEALGKISFTHYIGNEFFSEKNKYTNKDIVINVDLKFTEQETKDLLLKDKNPKTKFIFYSSEDIEFNGALTTLFNEDKELNDAIFYIKENLVDYFSINREYTTKEFLDNLNYKINRLLNIENKIWLKYKNSLNEILTVLFEQQKNMASSQNYEYDDNIYKIIRAIETIKKKIKNKYDLLPVFYYRKLDEELQSVYNIEEIKEAIKIKKGLLYKFMLASQAPLDEFVNALESKNENEKIKSRNSIKEKVKYNIQKKFNYFYEGDSPTKIKVNFDNDCLKILVKTKENTTYISERSNGLKWFLNIFIDLLSKKFDDRTIVYLLDEPGIYLHVNAQRELLKLFKNLCSHGNQVVYTTHSPYMIDTENVINVRAIEKDANGITHIFNNAYDNKFNSASKRETITPLLKAIGADIKYNLGPSLERLNIVTEGITDYMYMTAMLDYLNIEEEKRPYILPSVGAGNINSIVSILIGWGCNYKVVLDYDKAGYIECNKLIEGLNLKFNEDIFFVNCKKTVNEKDLLKNPEFVESLVTEEDKNKFSIRYEENKTMAAKEFHDKVTNKTIKLSNETVNNFKRLFIHLGIIKINSKVTN